MVCVLFSDSLHLDDDDNDDDDIDDDGNDDNNDGDDDDDDIHHGVAVEAHLSECGWSTWSNSLVFQS